MKKRIHTIDGKILVQGGTDNELKSNEIRVNADKSLTERVDGKVVSVGGSGTGGNVKIVPLTNQCKVEVVDTGDLVNWIEITMNEDGSFPSNIPNEMLVRVYSPNLVLADLPLYASPQYFGNDGYIQFNHTTEVSLKLRYIEGI